MHLGGRWRHFEVCTIAPVNALHEHLVDGNTAAPCLVRVNAAIRTLAYRRAHIRLQWWEVRGLRGVRLAGRII